MVVKVFFSDPCVQQKIETTGDQYGDLGWPPEWPSQMLHPVIYAAFLPLLTELEHLV